MIDPAEFTRTWRFLVASFGATPGEGQADAYYDFLSPQMDTEQFVRAARALWSSNKFFPRPIEFVLHGLADEWFIVLQVAEHYTPPHGEWLPHWQALSERSRQAIRALGGNAALRQLYARDATRMKTEWERAYQQIAVEEGAQALPAASEPRKLRPA